MVTILVTGSRDWYDAEKVFQVLDQFAEECDEVHLVHGACRKGVDMFVDKWVGFRDWLTPSIQVTRFPANWNLDGKRAGFLRNHRMVHAMTYDMCLAFIRDNSKGATMTMALAVERGIPVNCFREWSYA